MSLSGQSATIAFLATAMAGPLVLLGLRRFRVLDVPGARSSHDRPTPRGGGVAPALGALLALAAVPAGDTRQRLALLLVAGGFGAVGLAEDLHGIGPMRRLLLQAAVAGCSLVWLLHGISGSPAWRVTFALGCLSWLVAFVNGFNFMDGINGISGAQVVLAGMAWWIIGEARDVAFLQMGGAAIAAAGLAFLPFNFPNARMFLGDVGSYFFGGWLGVLVVVGLRAGVPPEAAVFPLFLCLADTASTLVRRRLRGEAWYLPHRDHVYQQLVRSGWSHTATTLVAAAYTAVFVGVAMAALWAPAWRIPADIAGVAVVVTYLRLPQRLMHHPAVPEPLGAQ